MITSSLWIGLVNIVPKEGNLDLGDAKGAFTNFIAFANSRDDFLISAQTEFEKRNYVIVDVEDIEPLSVRINKYQLREDLLTLARYVEETGNPGIDRLHIYEDDDELN